MADEHPDKEAGDVIFTLKQQEHKVFKRRGADLFIEKKVSVVEAMCGFSTEITHLDGRKLLVKTAPGDCIKPMHYLFNPMAKEDPKNEWEVMEDADVPDIETVAQADTTDVDKLKKAAEGQLKKKGMSIGVFVINDNDKKSYFKQCTREEALAAKKTKKGCNMYIVSDPDAQKGLRMMKAVKGEGMPTFKNPFVHGNLFLIVNIEFPQNLTAEVQDKISAFMAETLPPPANPGPPLTWKEEDEGVEVHTLTDLDPVFSHNENKENMSGGGGGEAYDDDQDKPGSAECKQM